MGESKFFRLNELFLDSTHLLAEDQVLEEISISGVHSNSSLIKKGFAFVAVSGSQQDGHDFAKDACERGASVILGERAAFICSVPYVRVKSARRALAFLAAKIEEDPSQKLQVYGVTGTSGKTTTTLLLESILRAHGKMPALLGTVSWKLGNREVKATHTTPGSPELQKFLSDALKEGCDSVVMEVSSHAIDQERSAFVYFDCVGLTNLSHEHLDYHVDMETYFNVKLRLFTDYLETAESVGKSPRAIPNTLNAFGERIQKLTKKSYLAPLLGFSNVTTDLMGTRGHIEGESFESKLVGEFNFENILLAASMAHAMKIPKKVICRGIQNLNGVPGRLEKIIGKRKTHVFVDYAHKPDALEKVLRELKRLKQPEQKIVTVFGCGGDRDRTKRPLMGKIASEISDQLIITSDNPRSEDPKAIIHEILQGIEAPHRAKCSVEADRSLAIRGAIDWAGEKDIVLIAGKGHETTQILGPKTIFFDDRVEAKKSLDSMT